ncbi:nuclear transport factor 2 family protein [Nocardioides sp.]|uniref:nuclear transport factor 2 family protein n=1 Tax=Nocardioides sp. TaxID=35761 RepID=UPI002627A44B|nr:nuclear transport factor 2 family protein [Nocardioides sp.]
MQERVLDPADDTRAIEQLKYRYVRLLDTKQWDGFADCFTAEATGDYNGLAFADPSALVAYMREHLVDGIITLHQVHHPEITLDPDDPDLATGRWYLQDKVIVPAFDFILEGAAFYEDRYRRTADGWRIAHTGYARTYELTWSLADLPSAKVGGPGTHTHADA